MKPFSSTIWLLLKIASHLKGIQAIEVRRVIKALWSLETYSTNRHIMDRHINHMFLREGLFHPIASNGNCFPLFETKKARMLP